MSKVEISIVRPTPEPTGGRAERAALLRSIELRLNERLPEACSERIRSCVEDAADALAGARIQQFLPILIERLAGESLGTRTTEISPS